MIALILEPLFGDGFSGIGHAVTGIFAVAGGYLLGSHGTGMMIGGNGSVKNKKGVYQPPGPIKKNVKRGGGGTLALLVGYFFFGGGIGQQGDGPGGVPVETGIGTETVSSKKPADPAVDKPDPKVEPGKSFEVEGDERLKVTILGGDAKEGKFYLVKDESVPVTLKMLLDRIGERQRAGQRPLKQVVIYVYKNSSAKDGPVVRDLENQLRDLRLGVSFPPVDDTPRPGT